MRHTKEKLATWNYCTVEDSGPGVPETCRADIFERFFSARQGSAMRENSSGLGLYICKQVVEAHEGVIEVYYPKSKQFLMAFLNLGSS
jgi:signal transduction histidine kinase